MKRITKKRAASKVLILVMMFQFILLNVTGIVGGPLKRDVEDNDQNISFEDKSFNKYTRQLLTSYNNRNYFSAIYQNENTRDDFAKFLNEGLTQQVKDDLAGLRFYKKVGDVEVPVILFSPQMDSWLGILPQWKRTKRYIFKKIEEYLSLHPEVLNQSVATFQNSSPVLQSA